jgi:hypothetical protein
MGLRVPELSDKSIPSTPQQLRDAEDNHAVIGVAFESNQPKVVLLTPLQTCTCG